MDPRADLVASICTSNGLAPKDSVNWGFNEVVAGFYSGVCAMLDKDPDALIAIASAHEAG
jgi:multiple sugar transport system substrate-binding protein